MLYDQADVWSTFEGQLCAVYIIYIYIWIYIYIYNYIYIYIEPLKDSFAQGLNLHLSAWA